MKNTPWNYVDGDVVDCTGTIVSVSGIAQPHGYVPIDDESHQHGRLLSAAPEMLAALKELLPTLREMAQPDAVYGFFHGGDPRNFQPDGDSTDAERAAHKAACEEYERSQTASPSCCEHRDGIIINKAPFGLGVNTYQDDNAVRLLALCEDAIAKAEGR